MPEFVMQIMWHINNECNLDCAHCYARGQCKKPVDRWPIQQLAINRIVELSTEYQIIRVGLLGGEPLLDPNILRLITTLRQRDIARVDISTNGTMVSEGLAKQLVEAGATMVQVSLEGPTPEINDPIRGKGSFNRAVAGLRRLGVAGLQTGIMVTISKGNLECIRQMAAMAHKEGVKIIAFNRMLPIGHGGDGQLRCLDPTELHQMIRLVHKLNDYYPDMDVSSDDPLLHIPLDGTIPPAGRCGGCGAGIGNLTISYDGTVFPCRRLPIKVGDISETSLIEIINSAQLDCLYDRAVHLKGKCRTCLYRESCGGCRAAAKAFTGDFLSEDPQCWLSNEARR